MRLAVLDDYEDAALNLADWGSLRGALEIDVYRDHLPESDGLAARLLPYDILIIMRERTPFPRSLIERLPNLRLLVTTSAKNRSIDLTACRDKGIAVCGTESSKDAAVELTWGLILSSLRRIPQHDRAVRNGMWGDGIGSGIDGKVLGVLGLGKKGKRVAQVGLAFGMKVVAWSQHLKAEDAAAVGVVRVEKDELFKTADIITIHLVLGDRTSGLVGADEIGLMKPSSYLINTSRGPIVQEKALIAALKENRIAGAGLDVFETEPLPRGHPLLSLSNVVLTPHVGYVTQESFRTYFTQAKEDVEAWLAGEPIRVLR